VNKTQLIEAIAKETRLTKADAGRALDATLASITRSLRKKVPVTIMGFGTFKVVRRKARNGRNPQTGEAIKIKARRVPRFTPGADLRRAIK